jgi:hypothetical protein
MKGVLLMGLLLAGSPQESVTLQRTFSEGEKMTHKGNLLVTLDMGQIEVNFDLEQTTKKVSPEGSGAISAQLLNIKTLFNGNDLGQSGSGGLVRELKWDFTLDRVNQVVEAPKQTRGLFNQLISAVLMTSVLSGSPLKVGEKYKVSWKGADNTSLEGETTLAEIKEGVARLTSAFDWQPPMMEKKAKLQVTSWIEVKSGQIKKLEGTANNLVGPQGVGLQNLSYTLEKKS